MKISDEEIGAAIAAFDDARARSPLWNSMGVALEAAYTVRKARKAAKRAKAKPSILDEDQQEALRNADQQEPEFKVGDRVVHSLKGFGTITTIDKEDKFTPYLISFDGGGCWTNTDYITHSPAKPVWNGKFEVGKAYRTRDGQKVIISDVINSLRYPLRGELSGYFDSWTVTGCNVADKQNSGDLVGPWED